MMIHLELTHMQKLIILRSILTINEVKVMKIYPEIFITQFQTKSSKMKSILQTAKVA